MKVKKPSDYRSIYTLEEVDIMNTIIKDMKEDESKPGDYLAFAAREYMDTYYPNEYAQEVITAAAETCKNRRIWNAYGEDTKDIDVWIEGIVKTSNGILEIGACFSDIWETGGTHYAEHICATMYKPE